MAVAILDLGGVEIRTTDALTVQTLWRLMQTRVPAGEMLSVMGDAGLRRSPVTDAEVP